MELATIASLIYIIRGQRVMLDSDLALLYGVPTKSLNLAVKRNLDRFPLDFSFVLSREEAESLRFQFETSKKGRGGRRHPPRAFTEHGMAMLSSVLNSERAVRVNISIVRAFISLRQAVLSNRALAKRLTQVEKALHSHHKALGEHAALIQKVFEDIRGLMRSPQGPKKRIGFLP